MTIYQFLKEPVFQARYRNFQQNHCVKHLTTFNLFNIVKIYTLLAHCCDRAVISEGHQNTYIPIHVNNEVIVSNHSQILYSRKIFSKPNRLSNFKHRLAFIRRSTYYKSSFMHQEVLYLNAVQVKI